MNKKFLITQVVTIMLLSGISSFSQTKDAHKASFSLLEQRDDNTRKLYSERSNIITQTVAKVSPAVVGINVTEIRQYDDPFARPFMNDPFFKQFFGDRSYSQEVKSLGSGFIISPDGYIITNDHVAGNGKKIVVTLTNGKHYEAKIVGTDKTSDICLLKIEGDSFPFIELGNSDDIIIGEWAIALGNPFGLFEVNDKPTVTVGVISASGMNLDPVEERFYLNMLQTDAAINGGNSGGPLVNSVGEVIGMNTIIFTSGQSQGSIGLGFAIPVNKIKRISAELKQKGSIDRNFFTGLSVQDIDDGIAKYFKLDNAKGVIVTDINKKSPAIDSGIEKGDVIIGVNNFRVSNRNSLLGILQEFRTEETVTFHLLRDNKEISKELTLRKRP